VENPESAGRRGAVPRRRIGRGSHGGLCRILFLFAALTVASAQEEEGAFPPETGPSPAAALDETPPGAGIIPVTAETAESAGMPSTNAADGAAPDETPSAGVPSDTQSADVPSADAVEPAGTPSTNAGDGAAPDETPSVDVPSDTQSADVPSADAAEPALDLSMETMRRRITGEAPTELLSLQLGDTDVSLQVSGYWKGEFQVNWGMSKSSLGWAAASTDSPVLFTQEADLTLSLWIRDRWFVEANFLDDTALNTYRAGYQGLPGEAVQYVGVGNTGLDYPVFSYMDLGGDSPSSFGLYGRFGGRDLTFHTLFRWDAAAREERIFVGDRERTFSYVPLSQPLRGRSFVLPDDSINAGAAVYLEDKNGAFTDEFGRRWRLAVPSEYGVGALSGRVELNITPPGMVAVAYTKGGTTPWAASMGTYAGSGFLRRVQDWFNSVSPAAVDLADYPQSGQRPGVPGIPGHVSINGVPALVIYEPGAFSPFERLSRYTAPSSNSTAASVVTLSTGERIPGYDIIPLAESAVSSDIPLYAQPEFRRGVYELFGTPGGAGSREPQALWPLAGRYPGIYLPGSREFMGDLGIRFTNYGAAGAYAIGTDVVPGSVQVYRNGLLDPDVGYNAASGEVSLRSPAGLNEVIRITYLKRSDETKMGSVAAGIGAVYDPAGSFSSEFALGLRWNLAQDSYSENGVTNPGTVGASVKTAWDFDRLKARVSGGLTFEQPDTTGLYRIAGMEGNELTLPLPPADSFISHPSLVTSSIANEPPSAGTWSVPILTYQNRAPLIYRNYRETSVLGSSTIQDITWGGSALVEGKDGPYPARDSGLSSLTVSLVAEFSLDASRLWSGFEVPLGDDGKTLEGAGAIEIPFRFYDFSFTSLSHFALILQIGALSEKDAAFTENQALIMEKVLFSPTDTFHAGGRVARFNLTDEDRRKLRDAKYLRIIAVHDGSMAIGGRVILAPPIVKGAGFRPILAGTNGIKDTTGSGPSVEVTEEAEFGGNRLQDRYGSLMGKLHPSGSLQRVLEVKWEGLTASGEGAGADGRIAAIPFANYRTLSFFVKGPSDRSIPPAAFAGTGDEYFRFIIARGPESLGNAGATTLDVRIPLYHDNDPARPVFPSGEWSKVELRYVGGNRVTVNGVTVPGASRSYRSPGQVSSAR
jgi:hypothetical protein